MINFVLVILVFSLEMSVLLTVGFLPIINQFALSPQLSHQHPMRASKILRFSVTL